MQQDLLELDAFLERRRERNTEFIKRPIKQNTFSLEYIEKKIKPKQEKFNFRFHQFITGANTVINS